SKQRTGATHTARSTARTRRVRYRLTNGEKQLTSPVSRIASKLNRDRSAERVNAFSCQFAWKREEFPHVVRPSSGPRRRSCGGCSRSGRTSCQKAVRLS